jgi:hypothetical protein
MQCENSIIYREEGERGQWLQPMTAANHSNLNRMLALPEHCRAASHMAYSTRPIAGKARLPSYREVLLEIYPAQSSTLTTIPVE